MKVIHVLSSLNPKTGGVALAVHNFVTASQVLQDEHEVLCLDSANDSYVKDKSYIVHAIGRGNTAWNYHKGLKAWLIKYLNTYNTVIVHGLWQYQSYAVVQGLKKLGVNAPRLFVMPHGMLDPYFQHAPRRRLKAVRNIIFWHFVEKRLINRAEGLLFTCEQELILAKKTFGGYRPNATFNIGLGITRPPIFHNSMLASVNKPYWLFLSRIHPKKGVDLLIRAYKKLYQENHNIPDLIIAGATDNHYTNQMIKLAAGHPNIHFSGMLQGDVKWGALYGCETFVLPSHQENFGIAVVEALACGKPVLISDQVNIWHEIQEGKGGIVTSDTEEGVYQALGVWLGMSDTMKRAMSTHAKQVYLNNFTIEQAAGKLKDVLIAN